MFLKTLSKYPESEICIFWNASFRFSKRLTSLFTDSFQLRTRFEDSSLRPVSRCLTFEDRLVTFLENSSLGIRWWPSLQALDSHLLRIPETREVQIHRLRLCHCRSLFQVASQKFTMSDKRRRCVHSSRVKFPLVNTSATWFLVSTCLIWILGYKLILSNNQSDATLWVLDTCLIVGLLPFIIILIAASMSSNTYNKAS